MRNLKYFGNDEIRTVWNETVLKDIIAEWVVEIKTEPQNLK
jgi:hypothetical protein